VRGPHESFFVICEEQIAYLTGEYLETNDFPRPKTSDCRFRHRESGSDVLKQSFGSSKDFTSFVRSEVREISEQERATIKRESKKDSDSHFSFFEVILRMSFSSVTTRVLIQ
jgi:hypothetical protein